MTSNTRLPEGRKRGMSSVSAVSSIGYRCAVDEHPEVDVVAHLAQRARNLVQGGLDDPELQRALDQYVADRSNGEPLGAAKELLDRALARVDS